MDVVLSTTRCRTCGKCFKNTDPSLNDDTCLWHSYQEVPCAMECLTPKDDPEDGD